MRKPDMPLLADRNPSPLAEQLAAAQAHVLIHCIDTRVLPPIKNNYPTAAYFYTNGFSCHPRRDTVRLDSRGTWVGVSLGHHPD
ncbi:hypothetical protein [Mycolicibacterium agri]|uniref:hypothetical protein n=1 Tax=Mycolicibacterium agri TaxID=36811 RepID=UPI0013D7CFD7|nr:hypothetical protein [Mycolicibacterium agri]